MKVLIIVPAYNEEKNLPALFKSIRETNEKYDILVINDSSQDNTSKICKDNNIKVVDLPVNLGIGGAIQTGYKYAFYNRYDIAIQVDGDGQHNPIYIEGLIKSIKKGNNMCLGSRFIDKKGFQSTFARRIGIKYFSKLISAITKQNITDPTSGFRACDKKLIEYFSREYPRDYPEPETIVVANKKGFKICEIPVLMNERQGGTSSITSLRSIYYMIKVSLAIIFAAISINK